MKIAYFDCFSGISGDMTLGALVDLGLDPELLKDELSELKLDGYSLSFTKSSKHGIAGTKAHVELAHDHNHDHHDHHHSRHLGEIRKLIESSDLSDDVKSKAISVFVRLGEAEAKVHDTTIE